MKTSIEAQFKALFKITKNSKRPPILGFFTPATIRRQKWLLCQILGGKPVKNVEIDPDTTDIWPKQLKVT